MNEHYVAGAGGARIRVAEHGQRDAPTVVLVHGLSLNSGVWDPVIPQLQERLRVLTPDLRGHGGSDAPDNDSYADSRTWAEDLAAVIELAGSAPVVLVGWSYGGMVALDYLGAYGAEALAGLILVSPLRKIGTEDALGLLGQDFLATAAGLTSTDLDEALPAIGEFVDLLSARPWDDAARQRLLGTAVSVPPRVRAAVLSRVVNGDDVLAAASLPTRVIYGDEDQVILPSAFKALSDVNEHLTLSEYVGVGHAPFSEEPARFASEIVEEVLALAPVPPR